jgi:C-terminal processing protease CtpA/Prc
MRITYARLFGPSGKPIAAGVTPDFIVNDKQRQLETAINEVRQLSPSMGLPLMMR